MVNDTRTTITLIKIFFVVVVSYMFLTATGFAAGSVGPKRK